MKPDDHSPAQGPFLDENSGLVVPNEAALPGEDRVIRQIVKRATNASAVLESIVDQWNSYQHGGINE